MALPRSRNQTYVPSTPVASADLNDLQDWSVRGWDALAGKDFLVYEEFLVGLGASVLTAVAGAPAQAFDFAGDGFGVMSLTPPAGDNETTQFVDLPLDGRRWRLTFRMRWKVLPTVANSYCFIGIHDTTGPKPFYFKSTGAAAHTWQLTTQTGDTNLTLARDTSYHVFELVSDGANFTAWIDGVLKTTVAQPAGFKGRVHFDTHRDAADGNAVELLVDSWKLWVAR